MIGQSKNGNRQSGQTHATLESVPNHARRFSADHFQWAFKFPETGAPKVAKCGNVSPFDLGRGLIRKTRINQIPAGNQKYCTCRFRIWKATGLDRDSGHIWNLDEVHSLPIPRALELHWEALIKRIFNNG